MSTKKPPKKRHANIVSFTDFAKKTSTRLRTKIGTLDIWKEDEKYSFSYNLAKYGKRKPTDNFIAFALTRAVEDIVSYKGDDPADILELTQEIIIRLGFEVPRNDREE